MSTVTIHLEIDDLCVVADALEGLGLTAIAQKFIAAQLPTCTWTRVGGAWCVRCPTEVSEGDHVFVRRSDSGIREVIVGELVQENKGYNVRKKRKFK